MPEDTIIAPLETATDDFDKQLDDLIKESAPAKDAAVPDDPKSEEPTGEGDASSPSPILKALDAITDDTKPEEKPSELTSEQKEILEAVPSKERVEQLYTVAEGYKNFTGAFESGKFDQVEAMFQDWNPKAWEGLLEHVYAKKVASGEWVDRYVSEADKDPAKQSQRRMQQQINELQSQLKQRSSQEENNASSERQNRIVRSYVDHIDGLFDKIEFSKADRRYVAADINNLVSSNAKVRDAVNAGNVAAVNVLFKKAVR